MIKINETYELELSPKDSLLKKALVNNIELNHSCGGFGTCGTCRVIVDNYVDMPDRNNIEQEMASDRGFNDNERLACQTLCDRPLTVNIPK